MVLFSERKEIYDDTVCLLKLMTRAKSTLNGEIYVHACLLFMMLEGKMISPVLS